MIEYLKSFDTHADYTAYTASTEFITPNVSICKDDLGVHYTPFDYSQAYFTTVAKTSGTIIFNGSTTANTLSCSTDNGTNWSTAQSVEVKAGDKVLWKGECKPNPSNGIGKFTNGTANFDVEGNVMSLLYGDNFKGQTSLVGKDFVFRALFTGNTKVISAENLSLPATTLAQYCYTAMFYGCTSLETAPELPATTLAKCCYQNMFWDCTSLATAPELPATTLADSCYELMFYGCTSLTTAPELPATILAYHCYGSMFYGCTSLATAPVLTATRMADGCYSSMFRDCTSLTSAPVLPATTLAQMCYSNMFKGCTSLSSAPALPATTLVYYCYNGMFDSCTRLNSITCLATNISASNCTTGWVNGVAATGKFTKAASMSSWTTGADGIPSGWDVEEKA